MIQACIFDLDGVLVDTAVYHYQAWKRLANEMGFDFTEEQNEQLKGISRMDSLDKILGWGQQQKTPEEKALLAARKNGWYVEMIGKMTPAEILPGALDFLKAARAAGLKTGLGSASKNSALILERTGLLPYFDVLVDGNHVTKSKPDPEVFVTCAQQLGIANENCVVFEDAEAGVQAAKAAHMKCVGIGSTGALTSANRVVPDLVHLTPQDLNNL
ncbi:beta-phosphoglucomutase [Chitinophaga costaii]|uniref:Beta-phosphoglucomutase n=1 Tax=Chitinophaga costaii TaxID=1335309 RepID=A0A1C4BI73_9BACT|nr:beta-phosphoglucomutase [Chitinophaga costaii]PUZ27599.1 beta-phosphoglucomutase [Chitinophaga costaii]SCC06533.1 beta-phosphoglucomutase [Chitinophaga costaii]